jgi:type I restriction enzyme S subunit
MAGDSKEVARAHLADAGVEELPDDWDVVTLGDLFTEDRGIAVGVMYPGDHDPNGVPLIKAGDLSGSIINPQPDFRISKEKHHEYRRTALNGGELLMTLVGNIGQCAVVPPRMAGWNAARAVAVMRLAEPSDTHFIQQCLLSRPLQHLMDVWCNTTVQATLNLKEIRQLPLPWPPKKCRDAIAAFGKALDDKIELNRRMNATLEAMARALFQSWFVDFDPVRAKLDGRQPVGLDPATAALFPDSFQDSEAGNIPKGWEVAKLKELTSKIGSGATPRGGSEVYVDEGPALIRSQNVYDYEFRWPGLARLTDKSAEELKNVEVMKNDVLLNITGDSILRTCIVDPAALPARVNQHVAIIRATNDIPAHYLHLYLVQESMKSFLIGMSAGATRHAITKGHLESIEVLKPSALVLKAFEQRTMPWFAQIDANRSQSRTLATLRDTLLPKLLRGELSSVADVLK